MGADAQNSLDKQPALLVWSWRVCGTGIEFYILWPHTAAFSKQSTIIRSDKTANTVHSHGLRKKSSPPTPLFVKSLHRILMSLCLPSFSCSPMYVHIVLLPLFLSILSSAALQIGCIFNTDI